jgi:tetratricopeptide (TPR) repeat protein
MMAPRVAVIGLALSWAFASGVAAQDLNAATRELVDIESRAADLRAVTPKSVSQRSPTYVEERLTDGELFYRLKDYVRASIFLTDIVDNFPGHIAYPDALYLLGESLFHAGDYLGARSSFRGLLEHSDEPRYRSRLPGALARLIEIAIRIRNFDGIDHYLERLSRLPASDVTAATLYLRAKYLYSQAVPGDSLSDPDAPLPQPDPQKLEAALTAFDAVPDANPFALQARYYSGVIQTLRGQYNPAIEAFKRATALKPKDEAQSAVYELAVLALGRLYYETSQTGPAIEAYQRIPRTSPNFETALYEIAWAYIRMGDSINAERSLEVLSVAAPDSQYLPDALVLRGNLLLRDGRFDAASAVFAQVTKEFQPVRDQLDQLLAEKGDARAYFRDLVKQNLTNFDEQAFLPPLALRWSRIEGDTKRAIQAVGDLSQARQLTGETEDLAKRLSGALTVSNPVNLFADLRSQRERTIGLRNRIGKLRQRLIAADEAQAKQINSSQLDALRKQRRGLERAIAGLPIKDSDFTQRHASDDGRIIGLNKELSSLEVQLLGMDARIVAIDRYMSDTIKSEEQRVGVEAYRAELVSQRRAIADYRDQMAQLHRDIESARLHVGVGDSASERDAKLRSDHAELVAQERQLIASLGGQIGQTDGLFRRADAVEAGLNAQDALVDQVVEERTRAIQKVLTEEGGKLEGYRATLVELDATTEDVVGTLALGHYQKVQRRFYDLVLKADVGVVDVGWAVREEHRNRIENLTRERARALQSLDDEFREIMDERSKP